MGKAPRAQLAQQQPEALDHQPGVAATLEDEITVQGIALDRAVDQHLRLPAMVSAEQVQRRGGGDQLHDGSGIARRVNVVGNGWAGIAHALDENTDGVGRHVVH